MTTLADVSSGLDTTKAYCIAEESSDFISTDGITESKNVTKHGVYL